MKNLMKQCFVTAIAAIAIHCPPTARAQEPKPGSKMTFAVKGVEFTFCYIPAGAFMMGSPESETGRGEGEKLHKVIISKPFYMMENEITQEQYEAFVGTKDDNFRTFESHFKGAKRPRESISLVDDKVKAICDEMRSATKKKFRLPTEAEWEYACRAGTTTPFCYGRDLDWNMANFDGHEPYGNGAPGKLRNKTVEVKQFKPNAWGLYDMHGNVAEVCMDFSPKGTDLYVDGIVDPGAVDPEAIARSESRGYVNTVVAYVAKPGAVSDKTDHDAGKSQKNLKAGKVKINHLGSNPGEVEVDSAMIMNATFSYCGGGYNSSASECRSAARRVIDNTVAGNDFIGFRLVLIP